MLAHDGHQVTPHARNETRLKSARSGLPQAENVAVGDVSTIKGMPSVAEQANALGRFDAVIHNVGIGYREARRIETEDGLPHVFAINVMAPYLLTALMERPKRLVYLSSGMHHHADANLGTFTTSAVGPQIRRRRTRGSRIASCRSALGFPALRSRTNYIAHPERFMCNVHAGPFGKRAMTPPNLPLAASP
jgi:NAD(P)-dependent dehydrogenase (short-subunit alcohol dehydrogenase family)